MADLSPYISSLDMVLNDCIDSYIQTTVKPRNYVGLSQIGIVNVCERKAWYMMRRYECDPFPGRVIRLFRTGDDCENNMVLDLKGIGLHVYGDQREVVASQDDVVFKGHIDGIVEGLEALDFGKKPCLLEIKSANNKRFENLVKLGSYCEWDEVYKGQVHVYATLSKLKRILVGVENKDNSTRYFERFNTDRKYAINLLQRGFEIYNSESEPERACPRRDWYMARFCNYCDACWR